VTACPPEVTNCPLGKVVTETVALYTTICPVADATITSVPTFSTSAGPLYTTSTVYTTKITTVISCPSYVVDCPAGSTKVVTSTYALYTTVCPVEQGTTVPAVPVGPATVVVKPSSTGGPKLETPVIVIVTASVVPIASAPYGTGNSTKPTGTGVTTKVLSTSVVTPTAKPIPATGAAERLGASVVALLGVAAVALML
jgi:chitinase